MKDGTKSLISIIVPVYNVEKYLKRCTQSILNQTYKSLELILINDGSTDSCPQICDELAEQDSRIRVIHQKNAGLAAARNAGIEAALGEYIGFVDSDDYVSKDMYQELLTALEENDADMSVCNFKYVGERETDFYDNTNLPIQDDVLTGMEVITKKLESDKNWYWVIACNKLYKRRLYSDIRYPVGKLHEDEFVIHKLLLKCDIVAAVSKMLYFYLQRDSGITGSTYNIRRLDSAEAHFDRANFFLAHGVAPCSAYYACSIGLLLMANSYSFLSLKDKAFKERYSALSAQFKSVAAKLLRTNLPLAIKVRLKLNQISPYYTWRMFERHFRKAGLKYRIKQKTV